MLHNKCISREITAAKRRVMRFHVMRQTGRQRQDKRARTRVESNVYIYIHGGHVHSVWSESQSRSRFEGWTSLYRTPRWETRCTTYNHAVRETRRETKAVARVTTHWFPYQRRGHLFCTILLHFIPIILSLFPNVSFLPWHLINSLPLQIMVISFVFLSVSVALARLYMTLSARRFHNGITRFSWFRNGASRARNFSRIYNQFPTNSSPFPFTSETLSM